MTEKKGRSGRPPGVRYTERLMVYATERDVELLNRLAEEFDTSQAGAVRRLIRDAAKERGWTGGAE